MALTTQAKQELLELAQVVSRLDQIIVADIKIIREGFNEQKSNKRNHHI